MVDIPNLYSDSVIGSFSPRCRERQKHKFPSHLPVKLGDIINPFVGVGCFSGKDIDADYVPGVYRPTNVLQISEVSMNENSFIYKPVYFKIPVNTVRKIVYKYFIDNIWSQFKDSDFGWSQIKTFTFWLSNPEKGASRNLSPENKDVWMKEWIKFCKEEFYSSDSGNLEMADDIGDDNIEIFLGSYEASLLHKKSEIDRWINIREKMRKESIASTTPSPYNPLPSPPSLPSQGEGEDHNRNRTAAAAAR